jgi:MSHA biogenesis protein MshJ
MNLLSQLMKNFSGLQFRERAIAVAVGCSVLALGGNLVLLKPLQLEIDRLGALEQSNKAQIASVMKDLANVDGKLSQGVDPFEKELATRDELLKKIAEGEAFFVQHDATVRQVGSLVRNVLEEMPGISLVSFKTLPGQVFYAPPPPPPPPKATEKAVASLSSLLPAGIAEKAAPPPPAAAKPAALQKIIYKHGVEISVKGNYAQLVSYMEKLQKFPKRVFWSEANITVSPYPVSVLRMVIFTLSDQPLAPLE